MLKILMISLALILVSCSSNKEEEAARQGLQQEVDSLREEVEATTKRIDSLRQLTDSLSKVLN